MINNLPKHIAIIMDGNGRWAKQRQLPRIAGHRAGVENVRVIVRRCAELGIEALTLFAFSSENWRRPPREVSLLLDLFVVALEQEVEKLHDNNVRLKIIGDTLAFPKKLQARIEAAEALTDANTGLNLSIAANYGGRWDIVRAVQNLAARVKRGELLPEDITESDISEHVCLSSLPVPDLFIRSGGEQRISNYLLWQLAYTELYFTEALWPDFDSDAFEAALESYQSRERRFGRTGEQVRGGGEKHAAVTNSE
ncbi:MAG: isoprenyl transferase [Gammaproteobacteria bacterium]